MSKFRQRPLMSAWFQSSHFCLLGSALVPAADPRQNVQLLEGFVQNESAHVSTPPIVGAAGHVIDASSDYFTTVMGFLDKFVKIGGEITKVSVLPSWTTILLALILIL